MVLNKQMIHNQESDKLTFLHGPDFDEVWIAFSVYHSINN